MSGNVSENVLVNVCENVAEKVLGMCSRTISCLVLEILFDSMLGTVLENN